MGFNLTPTEGEEHTMPDGSIRQWSASSRAWIKAAVVVNIPTDTVVASGGTLPALDGSNLTNVSAIVPNSSNTVVGGFKSLFDSATNTLYLTSDGSEPVVV